MLFTVAMHDKLQGVVKGWLGGCWVGHHIFGHQNFEFVLGGQACHPQEVACGQLL